MTEANEWMSKASALLAEEPQAGDPIVDVQQRVVEAQLYLARALRDLIGDLAYPVRVVTGAGPDCPQELVPGAHSGPSCQCRQMFAARLADLQAAVGRVANGLWASDPLNMRGDRVRARELYGALLASGVREEWGLRVGDGSVVPLAEVGSRYTITEHNLVVRLGEAGDWRWPTSDERGRFAARGGMAT